MRRVIQGINGYLECELTLPVNSQKSRMALLKDVTFLGTGLPDTQRNDLDKRWSQSEI